MLVLDSSAAVNALIARPVDAALSARLSEDGDLHAPHLIDVEFLQAMRRLVSMRKVNKNLAEDVRGDFDELRINRYPHQALADRIWALRHNFSAYDAAYIALAEALGAPLITCDAALARSSLHQARIELFSSKTDP